MSDNCIFCKIVAGEVPNYTVFEDDIFLAFLDVFPHAMGHTVIVPKRHVNNFTELSDEEMARLLGVVKRVMGKLDGALQPDGYNIGWNERPAGGQVVPHLHVHVLPRYSEDGGGSMHSIVKNPGSKTVQEVAEMIIK